ncbi:hypothetical protein BH11PSE3_BH11PSE3_29070 [soil metagenome]
MVEVRSAERGAPEGLVWVTFDDSEGGADLRAIPMFSIVATSDSTTFEHGSPKPAGPQPVKARRAHITASMTTRDAFTVLAFNCLAQMQGNEIPAKLGRDPEGIHQFRIGLRRLRALVGAFGDMLSVKSHRDLASELRWLQQELTATRDWQVFATSTLGPIARQVPDLQNVAMAAHGLQGIAQSRARIALQSPRYAALLLHCHVTLVTGAWASPEAAKKLDEPIGRFAGASLRRRHRRLRKFGGRRADLPDTELHRLRLVVKKQRYLCDFVRELYPKKPTARYITALAGVQDLLGAINDARVGQRLTAELELYMTDVAAIGAGVAARSAGIVLGWQAAARGEHRDEVGHLWKDFRTCGTFWSHAAA